MKDFYDILDEAKKYINDNNPQEFRVVLLKDEMKIYTHEVYIEAILNYAMIIGLDKNYEINITKKADQINGANSKKPYFVVLFQKKMF